VTSLLSIHHIQPRGSARVDDRGTRVLRQDGSVAPSPAADVEVVEPPIADRVRRPADLFRLIAASVVLVGVVTLADVAIGTAGALEQDLTVATDGLPRILLTLLSWAGGLGVIVLPVAVGADLLVRSRLWQLVHALLAAGVAAALVLALRQLILDGHLGAVLGVLTRPQGPGRTSPLDPVVVAMVALLTMSNLAGRKWISPLAVVVLGSATLTSFLAGNLTALALFCSFLLGWVVGLAFRYALGAASTRPPGTEVARVLVASGVPLARLELVDPDEDGDRRYVGTTRDSSCLDVQVMDRDTFGLASGRRLLRRVRLRSASSRAPALTLRAELERRVLMGLVLARAALPAPRPVAAAEVGPFSAVLALEPPVGRTVDELGHELTDEQLKDVWRMLGTLQRMSVAHRGLTPGRVLLASGGGAGVAEIGGGDIAADDLSLRIDTAQLLSTVALAVGAERAVATAVAELGEEPVLRALPVLQPIAMSRTTRAALREHKELLSEVRERIVGLRPDGGPVEPVELRRVTARTLVMVVGGGVAAYVVLSQLAQVDFGKVIRQASWGWALATVAFAALTFVGASLALSGAAATRLRFVRTYMTQLSVAFSGLVAPAAIGNIALNTRYLQKAGLQPAVAGASVGLAQIAQFCSYFVLLVVSGVLAGTGTQAAFTPPPVLVAAVPVAVLVLLALLAVPAVRRLVSQRVLPQVRSVGPQILGVLQHPRQLALLLGGALLLDASFVGAITCATRAFGVTTAIPAIAVVYFAGAIIGSAVPTPGGLGGIEAAMSAGLVAVGVDGGTAVSSVLLYRLATYWLPIPFGWISLTRLQKLQAI